MEKSIPFLIMAITTMKASRSWELKDSIRKSDGKTISASFDQVAFMPRQNNNHNLKFGMDYLNKKQLLVWLFSVSNTGV